jgi:hypothetical protein
MWLFYLGNKTITVASIYLLDLNKQGCESSSTVKK